MDGNLGIGAHPPPKQSRVLEMSHRKDLACCMLGQQDQTSKASAGMLCVAFVQCNRRLGRGQIRFAALLLVADAMLK